MPNRILKESICASDTIENLSPEEEVFFYRLLVQCDDFGRMDARPAILRARCYPLRLDRVTEQHIARWLGTLRKAKLVLVYQNDEQPYLQVRTWEKHQQVRAKRSKYPAPDEQALAGDSNGYQVQSDDIICPRNPIQSESFLLSEIEPDGQSSDVMIAGDKMRHYEPDSLPYQLAAQLRAWILNNKPDAKVPALETRPFQSWCNEIRLMLELDGREAAEVARVIDWCQDHSFWRSNILLSLIHI